MPYAVLEVISSCLEAAASEMCASLIRTAYSPNVKERADCSTALCDVRGRALALGTHAPAHLGATLKLVPSILERFPIEQMQPGDVFLANDPYIVGVTHLNDCTLASPIFHDGTVVAFAAAIAHHSDVGGRVPGSESGDSTSIFQEGIRLPPMRLFSAGQRSHDIWECFLLNSRTPHFSEGDLLAQLAAIERGRARVGELFVKHGASAMFKAVDEMLDATERRIRARIGDVLQEGIYSAEDWLDEDGLSDNSVRLAATITIKDRSVKFDFSNCSAQLGSGKNVPLTHTLATIYFCLKTVIDPDLPTNEALFRAITVQAPEGSVVNPRAPAGVSSRNLTSIILADVILNALGQAAPERAMAAGGPFQGIILGGLDPQRGRYFVDYENFSGGQGAMSKADGNDVMQLYMTNTSNLPVESTEIEFPLRIERYEFVPDSGGAGKYRGGLGICRDIRILANDVQLANRSARQKFAARGLHEGHPGALGAYILNPGSANERRLPSTASELPLQNGDLLRIVTPGGGGYGDPTQRDRSSVLDDLRQGKITAAAARRVYSLDPTHTRKDDCIGVQQDDIAVP